MSVIYKYILDMLPYMGVVLPVIILWRIFAVSFMRKKPVKTTVLREVVLVLFCLFIAGLASQTIIPKIEFTPAGMGIAGGGVDIRNHLNLIPFKVFPETYTLVFQEGKFYYFLINFLGNIILFMPFGFLIPLLWRRITLRKILLAGFLISLFIEVCQIPFARGTDVDDLWLNTLGAFLGYGVYLLFKRVTGPLHERCKVREQHSF